MPRQEIVLSYLIHPGEGGHKREVSGGAVPLSFSFYSTRDGVRFSYIPLTSYESRVERTIFLAERELVSNARLEGPIEYAFRSVQESGLVHITKNGERESPGDAIIETVKEGLRDSKGEGESSKLMDAQSYKENQAALSYLESAEGRDFLSAHVHALESMDRINREQNVAEIIRTIGGEIETSREFQWHTIFSSDRKNEIEEGITLTEFYASERNSPLQDSMYLSSLIDADRELSFDGEALLFSHATSGERIANMASRVFDSLVSGVRWIQDGTLLTRFIESLRKHEEARIDEEIMEAGRLSKEARIDRVMVQLYRDEKGGTIVRHTWDGLLKLRQSARIDRDWKFADKEGYSSLLTNPRILAEFGTAEAFIQKSFVMARKYGIIAEVVNILDAFFAEKGGGREATINDDVIGASDKTEKEAGEPIALIEASADEKEGSVQELYVAASAKEQVDAEFIEAMLLALSNPDEAFVEDIVIADSLKIEKDSMMEYIRSIERLKDKDTLLHEVVLSWNKDKPNRPAGMMDEAKLGWWDVGFDDVMDLWKPGWDYLDPPSKDYDYSKLKAKVYDDNGVPLDPMGPTNAPQVEVKTPVNHPIPEWSTVGQNEAWVDMFVFQEILIHIVGIFKRDQSKFAGMTGQQAMQYTLREVHKILEETTPWDDQYQRMFRFVRWHAEMISHKDSVTVLHREYKDWKDNIIVNGGVFEHPHTLSQMEVRETGVIESVSTIGLTEFELENYIDGSLTFSSSIASSNSASTSKLELYIDDALTHTFTVPDGVKRLSFEVEQGLHKYTFKYTSEVGDLVRISGIAVSGVHFLNAHTEQRDAGEVRGLRAVDHLIQSLIKYYQQHHKDKSKGAMKMKQRKIWLS